MPKILITIQVNFVLIPDEAGMRQYKFTWIVDIKICHQPIPSLSFLGRPLWFHNFFTPAILKMATLFYSQAVFEQIIGIPSFARSLLDKKSASDMSNTCRAFDIFSISLYAPWKKNKYKCNKSC